MEEPSCVIKDVEIDDRNCRIVQLEGLVSRARRSRASRIGALDTLSTPLKGVYISSIMKKPLDTADANNARLIIAFRPAGANSPKLTKTMVDHAVSTIINGSAVELLILMAVCQRVCCRSIAILRASVLFDRWSSSLGDNSSILSKTPISSGGDHVDVADRSFGQACVNTSATLSRSILRASLASGP